MGAISSSEGIAKKPITYIKNASNTKAESNEDK